MIFDEIEKSFLDFYFWWRSSNKVEIETVSEQCVTIYPKQFIKIRLKNPDLSFFELDKFSIDKKIIDTNWITFRGVYLTDSSFEVYLFNEGEFEFNISVGQKIGSATLKKMNFKDWKKRQK